MEILPVSSSNSTVVGKETAILPSLPPESKHEVVSDEDDTLRDKEIAKLMALISKSFKKIYTPTNNTLRTSSNTRNKNLDKNPRTDRRSGRVPFEQRSEPPAQPKVVYAPILDINYFCHFLDILENYNLMDDEPM
ncbi:hypothetical protein Tco_0586418 [Tanacetum coccineum]